MMPSSKKPGRRPKIVEGEKMGHIAMRADMPAATLIIDTWNSCCNACGGDASPDEKSHEMLAGYSPSHELGCGVVWTHVTSNYMGMEESVSAMRSDLIWQAHPIEIAHKRKLDAALEDAIMEDDR